MIAQDISVGNDPIPAFYDVLLHQWLFRIDGNEFAFDARRMPFTLLDMKGPPHTGAGADKALVLANMHRQVRKRFYG